MLAVGDNLERIKGINCGLEVCGESKRQGMGVMSWRRGVGVLGWFSREQVVGRW